MPSTYSAAQLYGFIVYPDILYYRIGILNIQICKLPIFRPDVRRTRLGAGAAGRQLSAFRFSSAGRFPGGAFSVSLLRLRSISILTSASRPQHRLTLTLARQGRHAASRDKYLGSESFMWSSQSHGSCAAPRGTMALSLRTVGRAFTTCCMQ